METLAKRLVQIADELAGEANRQTFNSPVEYVYNPLSYAREPFVKYIEKYAFPGAAIWVGMNPGPFGMAQTGVPFGDATMVREFLNIDAALENLPCQHPKRPIQGFDCKRSEVSGTRLWGFARDKYKTPDAFFSKFFVVNYCPLVFMGKTGKNITPDKLTAAEKQVLFAACDRGLRRTVAEMKSNTVVGVGAFAKSACQRALKGLDVSIGQLLHPSPASPAANRGWAAAAEKQLRNMGLWDAPE